LSKRIFTTEKENQWIEEEKMILSFYFEGGLVVGFGLNPSNRNGDNDGVTVVVTETNVFVVGMGRDLIG
jgi:hypothetical protein